MDTETRPPKNLWIDKMDTSNALKCMLENQGAAFEAVRLALNDIELVVDKIYNHLCQFQQGRIIYCGAGTSGRIATQDGVELYPTFGWDRSRVDYIIPGGTLALIRSIEGAEDDIDLANKMMISKNISSQDIMLCLAASGNTKFTVEIIKLAKAKNALTIGISNNKNGIIQKIADFGILLNTGFEIVAGSTRLKAGTAQKICLNLVSTLVMTKLGYVKN